MSWIPLRVRLVGVVVLLSALALTLSGLAASTALRGYLVGRVDDQLTTTIGRAIHAQEQLQAQERLQAQGQLQLGNGPGLDGPDPLSDAFVQGSINGTQIRSELPAGVSGPALPSDLSTRPSPFTVPSQDGRHGWRVQVVTRDGVLVVALPLDGVDGIMARLQLLELVGGAVVLVLLAGIGYFVVRRSLRPLVQVELAAQEIAAGDLTQRVPEGHPRTEVGSLSRSFNTMVAQIETAFTAQTVSEAQARASEERMRRFVADASHELRTPLTSIRGFAELYRQGALPAGPDVARAMSRVESEAQRMGGLVEDLLQLARLDQQRPLERTPVDLAVVAANAVRDAQAAAPARSITLLSPADTPCLVEGDANRLAQVLGNLLTNAVAHTPASAQVTLAVTTGTEDVAAGQAVVEVVDDGPGVADADKARIFERFYRADASRARVSGGNGLGLSIVAGLVEAHHGTVQVVDTPGGGATFRVRLPLLTPLSPAPASPVAPSSSSSVGALIDY